MYNRLSIIIIAIMSLCSYGICQEETQQDTTVTQTSPFGGFAGPVFKYTSTNSEMGMMFGGHAAMMVNEKYGVGIGSYGLTGNVDETDENGDEYELFTSMIGLEIHHVNEPGKLVHWMGTLFAGRGKVRIEPKYHDLGLGSKSDSYFILSPSAHIELNITPVLMLNGGIGFCMAMGVDDKIGVTGKDLSGLTISTSLVIGWF